MMMMMEIMLLYSTALRVNSCDDDDGDNATIIAQR